MISLKLLPALTSPGSVLNPVTITRGTEAVEVPPPLPPPEMIGSVFVTPPARLSPPPCGSCGVSGCALLLLLLSSGFSSGFAVVFAKMYGVLWNWFSPSS
jgi:hypothetical protein